MPKRKLSPAGVFALALAVRLLYLWQIQSTPFAHLWMGDGEAYHTWAARILSGDWFGQGVFYQAPLYPYFLALLSNRLIAVRIAQAVLGAASCALLSRVTGSAIPGVLLALYPPAIFYGALTEKTALAAFLTTALLALLLATSKNWVVAAGILLGLLALTRENSLILIVPIVLYLRQVRPALLFTAGVALVLLPVGLRNYIAGGEFHLTTAQFGPNFYIGNHAGASGSYDALLPGHGNASDERVDATRLAEQASARTLTPSEVSAYWTGRAASYIAAEPGGWLKLMARKVALALNASEISDTESFDVYTEYSWLLRILRPFDFGILLAIAILCARRRDAFPAVMAAAYLLSVVVFYVVARYRFPVVPMLLLPAAALPELRANRKLAIPAVAAVVALIIAHLPLDNPQAARVTNYAGIATALAREPENTASAESFYRRALEIDPRFPAAQFGLGTLLTRAGRPAEAIPHFRAALAVWPAYQEAHYNLAATLASTGQLEPAVAEYEEALRLDPADNGAQSALAKLLNNIGAGLASEGRVADAILRFQRALSLTPNDDNIRRNLYTAQGLLPVR